MKQNIKGMLSLEELEELVKREEIDTVLMVFTDLYGRFMGKRYDAEFFLEEGAGHGTHACDYLITVDMEMEPVDGYEIANWERGYGDFHLVPDFSTLRRASWLDRTAMVICDVLHENSHEMIAPAPRSMLVSQIEEGKKLGFTAKAGSELEYFIFQNSYQEASETGYQQLKPAGWYIEDYHALQGAREENFNGTLRRHLRQSGIPVENSKGEWGLGQHELNAVSYTHLTLPTIYSV